MDFEELKNKIKNVMQLQSIRNARERTKEFKTNAIILEVTDKQYKLQVGSVYLT